MTMPLSLTSSRYTGAAARRSLERASVVSSITSCPIQASGILPSEFEALGLSLSITASSTDRSPRASVGHLCRRFLSPRTPFGWPGPQAETEPLGESADRTRGSAARKRVPVLVICATLLGQAVVP